MYPTVFLLPVALVSFRPTLVYTCVYMCIHVYTCVYMCIHVYTCVYMCTKTETLYTLDGPRHAIDLPTSESFLPLCHIFQMCAILRGPVYGQAQLIEETKGYIQSSKLTKLVF